MEETTKNTKEIFTNQEAADYLRVATITLWRERKKGNISFRRVGAGKLIYTREDLDNYLEQQKRAAYAQN